MVRNVVTALKKRCLTESTKRFAALEKYASLATMLNKASIRMKRLCA